MSSSSSAAADSPTAALAALCSAKTRLSALESKYQETTRPLREEVSGHRNVLRQWMNGTGATCVPVTVRDADGDDVQLFLRVKTSTSVKPIGDEVFRQAFDLVDIERLRAAHAALIQQQQKRRQPKGKPPRVVSAEDVWTLAIENAVRELNSAETTSLSLCTSQERRAGGLARPLLLPPEMRAHAQALYDLTARLGAERDAYNEGCARDQATVEQHTPAVAQYLKNENRDASKRVNLRQTVPAQPAQSGQPAQPDQPSSRQPEMRRIPCVVRCKTRDKAGVVRITDFKRRVRTTLEDVFRGRLPGDDLWRDTLAPDARRGLFTRLEAAYTTLREEKRTVHEVVDLEFEPRT